MGLSEADYLDQLQQLLPRGELWSRDANAPLTALLRALGQELARVDARAAQLLDEADPLQLRELVPDWERVLGISPGAGFPLQARAAEIAGRLRVTANMSASEFIAVAKTLGYTITLEELAERWEWRAFLPDGPFITFSVPAEETGGDPEDPPTEVTVQLGILVLLKRLKPAHTLALFQHIRLWDTPPSWDDPAIAWDDAIDFS